MRYFLVSSSRRVETSKRDKEYKNVSECYGLVRSPLKEGQYGCGVSVMIGYGGGVCFAI